jgi:hypothetical protein
MPIAAIHKEATSAFAYLVSMETASCATMIMNVILVLTHAIPMRLVRTDLEVTHATAMLVSTGTAFLAQILTIA